MKSILKQSAEANTVGKRALVLLHAALYVIASIAVIAGAIIGAGLAWPWLELMFVLAYCVGTGQSIWLGCY